MGLGRRFSQVCLEEQQNTANRCLPSNQPVPVTDPAGKTPLPRKMGRQVHCHRTGKAQKVSPHGNQPSKIARFNCGVKEGPQFPERAIRDPCFPQLHPARTDAFGRFSQDPCRRLRAHGLPPPLLGRTPRTFTDWTGRLRSPTAFCSVKQLPLKAVTDIRMTWCMTDNFSKSISTSTDVSRFTF